MLLHVIKRDRTIATAVLQSRVEGMIKFRGTAWPGGRPHPEELPHDPEAQHMRQPKLDMKSVNDP